MPYSKNSIQKFLKIRGILRNLLQKESKTERISAESHLLIEKTGKRPLKPFGEKTGSTRVKTRGIVSLQYNILPPGAKGYFDEIRTAGGLINRHVTPRGQV